MKVSTLFLLVLLLFLPAITKAQSSFEVVVYGGTPGGIVAAVAASRSGAKSVLLIEPTRHVGGLSTSGINTAELEHMLRWTFGGISLEFYERMGKKYGLNEPVFYFEPHIAEIVFNEMLTEAKVQTRFQLRVDKVEKRGAHIQSLTLSDGARVRGQVFIDASYEGDLMARAGVSYTWGRESKDEFNEEAAGIRVDTQRRQAATMDASGKLLPGISARLEDLTIGAGDRKVMNYNFRLSLSNQPGNMVPIPAPTNYDRNRYKLLEGFITGKVGQGEKVVLRDILDLYPRRNNRMEVNNKQAAIISIGHFGGQFAYPDADYAKRDAIYEDHKQYTLGLLYFLAHDETVPESLRQEMRSWGLNKSDFADNGHWPYYLYIREARRLRGRYVVTQHDLTTSRRKDDSIGMSSHFIDSHHVQRVAVSPTEFVNEGRIWRAGYAWQIPYRALRPKAEECANLLVPVAASLTHVAFCAYRLESVWMIGGHAAGTAAALAIQQKRSVQGIHVKALQNLLTEQRQVLDFVKGQPEKFEGKVSPPEFQNLHSTTFPLYLLGYVQFRQARVTESTESLTKSLSLKPTAQAHKILGLNFVLADQPERIQTELTKAKELDPNDAETAYLLSRFYYTQNRFYGAISEAERAIKLHPGYVKAYDNLGLCYEGLGERDKAMEYYLKAIELNEKQAGKDEWPYINLGRLLVQKPELAEAVSYLKRAVAINPASAIARYQLGSALVKLARHGEAVDEFVVSARLDERYPDPHYQLSLVYRKLGRTGEADRELEIFKKLKGHQ